MSLFKEEDVERIDRLMRERAENGSTGVESEAGDALEPAAQQAPAETADELRARLNDQAPEVRRDAATSLATLRRHAMTNGLPSGGFAMRLAEVGPAAMAALGVSDRGRARILRASGAAFDELLGLARNSGAAFRAFGETNGPRRLELPRDIKLDVELDTLNEMRRIRGRLDEAAAARQGASAIALPVAETPPPADAYATVHSGGPIRDVDRGQYEQLVTSEHDLLLDFTRTGRNDFIARVRRGAGIVEVRLSDRQARGAADLIIAGRTVRLRQLRSLKGIGHPDKVMSNVSTLIDGGGRTKREKWFNRVEGEGSEALFRFGTSMGRWALLVPSDGL